MRRISLLIITVLMAAMPAGAAPGRAAPIEDRPNPDRNPAISLRQGFAEGTLDLKGWMAALRSSVESHESGSPLTFLGGELPDGCDDYSCPSIRPLPAGDLDGDGSEDVFTSERIDGAWSLKARRGLDGSVMWSSPIKIALYGYAFFSRADVSGDETPEIVLLEAHRPYAGVYEPLAGAVVVDLEQTVRVLRAGDGSVLWERGYKGSITAGGVWGIGNQIGQVEDLIIDLSVMDDANGDGVADILVERASRTYAYAALGTGASVVRASADTLDGVSGETSATIDLLATNGYPIVVPSGDLSGDGLADLVTIIGSEMSAYRATGGPALWTTSLSGLGRYPYPTPAQLNTGPLWDIAVETERPELGFLPVVTAFRGTDGQRRWSHIGRDRISALEFAGDVDGDSATDLVEVGDVWWLEPARLRFSVTSGASGATILDETVTPTVEAGNDFGVRGCYWCVADLNGDGISEVLLAWGEYTGSDETWERVAVHSSARSLSDGATLWERSDPTSFIFPVPVDINGNGTSDPVDYSSNRLTFIEGSTGASVADVGFAAGVEDPFGADIDETPGDEVVAWLWIFDPDTGEYTFGVEVANATGTLWSVIP